MNYEKDIEQFMYDFVYEAEDIDELWIKQLRCIFTTWCLAYDIIADTYRCDSTLEYIYDSIYHMIDVGYNDFYNYMVEEIV